MKKIIVTGGAGYIGSHTCKLLREKGFDPICIDNLAHGHRHFVKWGRLYEENILDTDKLIKIFQTENPEAVVHFAAFAYVGESVKDPSKYYYNNVMGSLSLLNAMVATNINKIVFSSTCATYGVPKELPIIETCQQNPINPYGQTKLVVEKMLSDFGNAYGIKSVALRYFNAAGADPELEIGEDHNPETHLIPLVLEAVLGPQSCVTVMGTDYETPDGTCVRDYIHVNDLAEAHILALKYLDNTNDQFSAFNLGTGVGASVLQVIEMAQKVTGKKVHHKIGARRPGDPPFLVADGNQAKLKINWTPRHSDLKNIIETASRWQNVKSNKAETR